jgi:hypothetical protein
MPVGIMRISKKGDAGRRKDVWQLHLKAGDNPSQLSKGKAGIVLCPERRRIFPEAAFWKFKNRLLPYQHQGKKK